MSDQIQAPPPEPILRPEARVVRADRSLAAMVLLVCTLGGMGIGFGSAMYLMRMQWGAAYPTTMVRPVAGCNEGTTVTWLGIGIRSVGTPMVLRVFDGTAAQRSGLRPGDVLKSFDGNQIANADQMVRSVQSRTPGDLVDIGVERNGQPLLLHARLGRR